METGLITKWVLVYNLALDLVICVQYNENQTTVSDNTIETFDTEEQVDARIAVLGMTRPVEDV